jgi:hypothetical protein
MEFELVHVPLDDERLSALTLLSAAKGCSIEALIQAAVSEFLAERRWK